MTITISKNLIELIQVNNNIEVINRTTNIGMTILNHSLPINDFELETILLTCGNEIKLY